jgi:1-acyl-sn-glycerol-3-phosphate acyltransferase
MKKEWFFWPLGNLFRRMGGIAVERSRHTSLTDQLAAHAAESARFELAVTPEGTRSRVTTWKRGFYFIALKAQLPIMLYAIDYAHKTVICTQTLTPSGDVEADMRRIMDYYRTYGQHARYPEKFALEDVGA